MKVNANSLLVNELAFVLIPIEALFLGKILRGCFFKKKCLILSEVLMIAKFLMQDKFVQLQTIEA